MYGGQQARKKRGRELSFRSRSKNETNVNKRKDGKDGKIGLMNSLRKKLTKDDQPLVLLLPAR